MPSRSGAFTANPGVAARSLDKMAADYVPGDVVHIPEGPFQGVCAVVRQVDQGAGRLHVDALIAGGTHGMSIGFDEVEWA